ncbi:TetR/AcrR family transcriptional regulator [Actibacterium sp. MT2.3-13A]|uniref:TetR/AcrR family transcriptional regulator n=1 Tax=Actibacterium sp. MT2.3-13A TaxID=2828332 RepID=UPI001BABD793|nr:TetR/AcrR family transcriptional regulator [Actibacterium sp. MT2.3-13A]
MARIRKSAEERRAQIIEVTLDLLSQVGVERLSTALVAERVGVTQAALFRYFPTKNELWEAVLSEIERRAREVWDRAQETGSTPSDRIRRILEAQLQLIAETPAIPVLIFSTGKFAAEDAIRPIHMRIMAEIRGRLLEETEAARRCGELPNAPAAADCVFLLMPLLQGTVLRWALSGRGFDLVEEGNRLVRLQLHLLGWRDHGEDT